VTHIQRVQQAAVKLLNEAIPLEEDDGDEYKGDE